jgi:ribose-phosphate pyrophosphokinase
MESYKITKYPDGTSYVDIGINRTGFITFRVNTYEDLWHLNQLVDAYNNIGVRPTVTIPNLIDAQADRRFDEGQSFGLKLVCKLLNSMDADFKIFHPHNSEVVEALLDNVKVINNSQFIIDVLRNITNKNLTFSDKLTLGGFGLEDLVLMSADAGGFKPLMKLCDEISWGGQVHSCSKGRSYQNGKSELTQRIGLDNFGGKDILIVDDICVYGGTFKGLAKLLRQRNVGKLYLAVSHLTIQNHNNDSVFKYFDRVFSTSSKFDNYWVPNSKGEATTPENLTLIKFN